MRRAAGLISIFLTSCMLGSCTSAARSPAATSELQELRIAYVGGLTGRNSQSSKRALTALKIAIDDANRRVGGGRRKIVVLPFDNESIPAKNVEVFQKISAAGVVAITGVHISNDALLLADLAEATGVPLLVSSATHPDISRNRKYVVQLSPTDDAIGRRLASFVHGRLKRRKVAVITDVSDAASQRVSGEFSKSFSALGGALPLRLQIRSGDQQFADQVRAITQNESVDAVFIAASSIESGFLIRQLADANVSLPLIGTDNWQNQDLGKLLRSLGQVKVDAYFAALWHDRNLIRSHKGFATRFEQEAGSAMTVFDADAALTYDSGLLIAESLRISRSLAAPEVMKALKTAKVRGVTGRVGIRERLSDESGVHMLRFVDGQMKIDSGGVWR